MALNLPASPTLNQTYTQGTKTWIWNGTTWKSSGGISTTVGLTAPTSPSDGTMWYDTSDGTLYIRTGSIWVEAVVAAAGASANPLPTGNTAQRPGSPTVGNMRINSETNYVEVYYSSTWFNLTYIGLLTATSTNATVTYSGNYAIHTFLTSGTFTPTYVPVGGTVDYLIVAGGGGGATDIDVGGGGGGGGLLTGTTQVALQQYTIVVGGGGPAGTGPDNTGTGGGSNGTQGINSSFATLVSIGGGYGGTRNTSGGAGGSGGGGGDQNAGAAGGAGTGGQGYAGGTSPAINSNSGNDSGGGGGAGGAASSNVPGPGLFNTIGNATFSAGGRGAQLITPAAGAANTGNGGTGARAGGSGIVIIRYRYQ